MCIRDREMGELKNALNELDEYREFVSMLNDVSDVKRILDDLSSDVRGDGGRKRGDYVPDVYKRQGYNASGLYINLGIEEDDYLSLIHI